MSESRSFDMIYSYAEKADVGRLRAFRERARARHFEHGGLIYPYWTLGEPGPDAVVFLPGGVGHGEIWFPFMLDLSDKFFCVAVSIPEVTDMAAYQAGVTALLLSLGIRRATLVGHSTGGMAAAMIARNPGPLGVSALALCLTGLPTKDMSKADRQKWTARARMNLRMRIAPFNPVKLSMARQAFARFCPDEYAERLSFWEGYLEETYVQHVYKKQYIAINTRLVPYFYRDYSFGASDFPAGLPAAIFESSADQMFSSAEHASLRALFPRASVVELGAAGQFSLYANERTAIEGVRRLAELAR